MSLFAPASGKPMELPKPGIVAATLASITDLGEVEKFDKSGTERKVLFYYLLAEKDSSGNHKSIVESFKLSVNEKANLYKRLQQINGEAPTEKTDIMAAAGKNLQLIIVNEKGKQSGKERTKITAAVPAEGRGMFSGPAVSQKIVDAFKGIRSQAAAQGAARPISDEDVPF